MEAWVNWTWGINHLPHEPRSVCLWVQLKTSNWPAACRSVATAWDLFKGAESWLQTAWRVVPTIRLNTSNNASQPWYYLVLSYSTSYLSNGQRVIKWDCDQLKSWEARSNEQKNFRVCGCACIFCYWPWSEHLYTYQNHGENKGAHLCVFIWSHLPIATK